MAKTNLGLNPWISIWTQPRKTIQAIVNYDPKYRFILLSFIYGLPMFFQLAQNFSLGQKYSTVTIVGIGIVLAALIGMLSITISSALIYWTGKWIGGKASFYPVRAAVSWSNVPNVVTILFWIAWIVQFKSQLFLETFATQRAESVGFMVVGLVQMVLSVWSLIILVKGVAQVQGFSAWKGLLNVLIPFFMVGIVVWLLFVLIA